MHDTPRYLTLDEAAEIFRVDAETLSKWCRAGKVPAFKTPGGRYRFHEPDLVLALSTVTLSNDGPASPSKKAGPQSNEGPNAEGIEQP